MNIVEQYAEGKRRYPKHLLLMRVGDFYEALNEDAQRLSKALCLTLTNRARKGQPPVPMCALMAVGGVAEKYVAQLLRQGVSVAILEAK